MFCKNYNQFQTLSDFVFYAQHRQMLKLKVQFASKSHLLTGNTIFCLWILDLNDLEKRAKIDDVEKGENLGD
jgi:hypothetical protein